MAAPPPQPASKRSKPAGPADLPSPPPASATSSPARTTPPSASAATGAGTASVHPAQLAAAIKALNLENGASVVLELVHNCPVFPGLSLDPRCFVSETDTGLPRLPTVSAALREPLSGVVITAEALSTSVPSVLVYPCAVRPHDGLLAPWRDAAVINKDSLLEHLWAAASEAADVTLDRACSHVTVVYARRNVTTTVQLQFQQHEADGPAVPGDGDDVAQRPLASQNPFLNHIVSFMEFPVLNGPLAHLTINMDGLKQALAGLGKDRVVALAITDVFEPGPLEPVERVLLLRTQSNAACPTSSLVTLSFPGPGAALGEDEAAVPGGSEGSGAALDPTVPPPPARKARAEAGLGQTDVLARMRSYIAYSAAVAASDRAAAEALEDDEGEPGDRVSGEWNLWDASADVRVDRSAGVRVCAGTHMTSAVLSLAFKQVPDAQRVTLLLPTYWLHPDARGCLAVVQLEGAVMLRFLPQHFNHDDEDVDGKTPFDQVVLQP